MLQDKIHGSKDRATAEADDGRGRRLEAKRSRRAEEVQKRCAQKSAGADKQSRKRLEMRRLKVQTQRHGKAKVQTQTIGAAEKRKLKSREALQDETGGAAKTENQKSAALPERRMSGGAEKQSAGGRPKNNTCRRQKTHRKLHSLNKCSQKSCRTRCTLALSSHCPEAWKPKSESFAVLSRATSKHSRTIETACWHARRAFNAF